MKRGGYWSSGGFSYDRDWLQPYWTRLIIAHAFAMAARTL